MPTPNSPLNLIRQGATQSGFLRKVFTQGANGVPPAQLIMELSQALKLVGITLPPQAQVGLDTVQVILAGGAFVNDLREGAAVLQCVGDLTTGIAGITDLLAQLGLLDPQVADFASLAANASIAVATDGANVLADIGTVLALINCVQDLGQDMFGTQNAANAAAMASLSTNVKKYLNPQVAYASTQVAAFTKGQLTVFDLVGNIAANSPVEFAGLFPGLAIYFPTWLQVDEIGKGHSQGWFSGKDASDRATFFQLVTTRKQVESVLINEYLIKPMEPFEGFRTIAPVISLKALSVLALLLSSGTSGDAAVGFDFNIIGAMRGLGVTPSVLGDDWLFKGLQRNETNISDWADHLPYPPLTLAYIRPVTTIGVVISGQELQTGSEAIQNAKAGALSDLQKTMQALDDSGDIEGLIQIPEAVAMLKQWANIHVLPVFYTPGDRDADTHFYNVKKADLLHQLSAAESANAFSSFTVSSIQKELDALSLPTIPVGEIVNMRLNGQSITTQKWFNPDASTDPQTKTGAQFWRYVSANYILDLSDYWKCLNVLSQMRRSNLFADSENVLDHFGSIEDISKQFQPAYGFFIQKQLNIIARKKLADNLGIPLTSLKTRKDSKGNLIFYQGKG